MAKQTSIEDQASTPVPGAESAAEAKATEVNQPAEVVVETPAWASELLASNSLLIESNNSVIKSNESLETLLVEIIESGPELIESNKLVVNSLAEFKRCASNTGDDYQKSVTVELVANPELEDYKVTENKSFRDPNDFTKEYTSGDDVSHLHYTVLTRLLNQGLIEEA